MYLLSKLNFIFFAFRLGVRIKCPQLFPLEIIARGPEALKAYNEAIQTGEKKIYRTRLMLVGQERVGKTSLKNSLTGQTYVHVGLGNVF